SSVHPPVGLRSRRARRREGNVRAAAHAPVDLPGPARMTGSAITLVAVIGAVSVLGAAMLHAIVAAFEHLPYATEREIAGRVRPDGKPTSAARLAAAPDHTDNAASVAYAMSEAVGRVSWSLIAVHLGGLIEWQWWAIALGAAAIAAFLSLMVTRAIPRQLARDHPLGTVRLVSGYTVLM